MNKLHEIQDAIEGLYGEGYQDALRDIMTFILSKLELPEQEPEQEPTPEVEDETPSVAEPQWASNGAVMSPAPEPKPEAATPAPEPEPEPASEPEPEEDDGNPLFISQGLMRAYEQLKLTPGLTSRQMRERHGGSAGVLYKLQERGLAEKRGRHFYAKSPLPNA